MNTSLTATIPSIAGQDASTFVVHNIPSLSSGAFGLLDIANTSIFAFSQDEWKSSVLIQFNQTSLLDTTACLSPTSAGLQAIISYRHGILLQYSNVILYQSFVNQVSQCKDFHSPTSIKTWTPLIDSCVEKVIAPMQLPPFNRSECIHTLAFTTNRIWSMVDDTAVFEELKVEGKKLP